MKIGFIGLGNVGGKLANNLIKSRYKVIVRDLDAKLSKKFKKKGAVIASSPKELAENSDIVITCLPSPKACSKVMTAKNGVLEGLSKNKIWLEMSTTDQSEVKRIGIMVKRKGSHAQMYQSVVVAIEQQLEIFQFLRVVTKKFLKKFCLF